MQGMVDFGRFGDERLQKGGPIFWRLWLAKAAVAFVGSAAIGRERSGFDAFFTIAR